MKKTSLLLFVAFVFGATTLNANKISAAAPDELFNQWETEFEENCAECNTTELPQPTADNNNDSDSEPTQTQTVAAGPPNELFDQWETEFEQHLEEVCETCDDDDDDEPDDKKRKDSKCGGSIGNLVWNDANENGIKDHGEKGLDDVKLTLKWIGEDGKWDTSDDEKMSTDTNKRGRYRFSKLCKGKYVVSVRKRDVAGYKQVYDPDGSPNHKAKVRLKNDDDDHTKADFGYAKRVTPATGSGTVALFVAGVISLLSLLTFRQLKQIRY